MYLQCVTIKIIVLFFENLLQNLQKNEIT